MAVPASQYCPVPSWLDPATEVTERHTPETAAQWVERTIDDAIRAGVPAVLAFDGVANLANETGHGSLYRAWNMGGVKASKSWADSVRARTGKSPPWYRAYGNVGSGDATCVYYRGYASRLDFVRYWFHAFVPKPATATTPEPPQAIHKPNYAKTGWLFWHGDARWFAELIEQGYKGEVTRANPSGSIREWEGLRREMRAGWVQSKIGVTPDGVWGTGSVVAAKAFQQAHGLPVTGEPDDATVTFLSGTVGPAQQADGGWVLPVAIAAGVLAWLRWGRRRSTRRR